MEVNKSFKDFWLDKSRFVVAYGGAGSSKSWTTAQKILTRVLTEENHRFLICRKVARTLRVSVFQLFKDLISIMDLMGDFKINKSDMTITYIPNNSQLLFFGLDDIEKLKSIQGITSIWLEECSEMEQNDLLELNRRLRGHTPYYKQIIITFNPISHLHWLKKHFFDNSLAKCSIYKSTYKDNKFIDDEYKQEIEDIKNYDIQQYNIYALGDWGVLNTNIVYHKYDYKKHISNLTIRDFKVLYLGIDFNIGGCVVVIGGIRGDELHIVDSFVSYDTESIILELESKYSNYDLELCPDSSGANRSTNSSATDIQLLKNAGFYVNAPKKNPFVRDRINSVNKMFSIDKLFVNAKLDKLSHSLQIQAFKENGEPEKFTEHKGGAIDDWNDSLGYLVNRKFGIIQASAGIHKMKNKG